MSANLTTSKITTFLITILLLAGVLTGVASAAPSITSVPSPVLVGSRFTLSGIGFSSGSMVNFFVATSSGTVNEGPLKPASVTSSLMTVNVPASIPLGEGVVALQVVNTDQGYSSSNITTALLLGSASAGFPSLTAINGVGLAATSTNPNYAADNVETVVPLGSQVTLKGTGFDTVNGVAVDVFCAAGKVGPFFLNPGNPALSANSIMLTLPASGPNALPVGPASFVISNKGIDGLYSKKSNAVSVPMGRRIQVMSVTQQGKTLIVDGTGFSTLTLINFYASKGGPVVNLGGTVNGVAAIAITLVSSTELRFAVPAGAVAGPAYVEALNPPFVPFTTTAGDPNGAFILMNTSAVPTSGATHTATATPAASSTPVATPYGASPTAKATGLPTASPTATAGFGGILMAGGMDNTVTTSGNHPTLASAEVYDEATHSFNPTGPMGYARLGHTMTVLENGTILVAGGHNAYSVRSMPSAELYNVKTGTFSFTGTMNSGRLGHSATLLNNGKVLVSGGQNPDFSAINLAEIYDPFTGQFTPTASMVNARMGHTATVLKDGTVLIAGGTDDNGLLASAELYDAQGAGSVAVGSMSTGRQGASATLLPNGTVLIAGGAGQNGAVATAEIYHPASRTFSRTGSMHAARLGHSATLLPNGTVLIAGGQDSTSGAILASAEIYNPATGTFSSAGSLNSARFEHVAGTLADGKVLIAGGFETANAITSTAEIYDPATGKFSAAGSMVDSRADQSLGRFSTTSGSLGQIQH